MSLRDTRAANELPSGEAVAGFAGGRAILQAKREAGGHMRFPDHTSYLRYQAARAQVQLRQQFRAARAAAGTGDVTSPAPFPVLTRQVFTSGTGSWTAPAGVTSVEYLLVGGGGGGGAGSGTGAGGGGGGGSVKTGTLSVTPGTSYNYSVGNGGAGGTTPGGGETDGLSGESSIFASLEAKGGGDGFKSRSTNSSGTYGYGGTAQSGDTPTTGGSGGNVRDGGSNPDQGAGGGGGGAGGNGVTSTSNGTDNNRGGAGGIGVTSSLEDGTPHEYGAGGKGADEGAPSFLGAPATFGPPSIGKPGADGAPNTGKGGGGGASHSGGGNAAIGGNGGSGIVVLQYYA